MKNKISKSVCVIGAGLSGLCTIKELKEAGHQVTCYESSDDFGGVFAKHGKANLMYDSLKLTVSNHFMAYSSFPVAEGTPRKYWSSGEYYQYLSEYVQHFNLLVNIHFNTRVTNVELKRNSYEVELSNGDVQIFEALVLCTGTNRVPKTIHLPNQGNFRGRILHSSRFRSAKDFIGERVVCIGAGESGVDVANEIAKNASNCILVARRQPSVVPRYIGGHTGDAYTSKALDWLTPHGLNRFMRMKAWFYLNFGNISEKDRLHYQWIRQGEPFFERFLTKNDDFFERVIDKTLQISFSEIIDFEDENVCLKNGEKIAADVVLVNTGYSEDFSAVSSFMHIDNVRKLYKHMISPKLGSNFALIGWARPTQGGVPLCSELQARYLAMLLSGEKELPSQLELKRRINSDEWYEEQMFQGSSHLKGLVNYHQFVASLASEIGCTPSMNFLREPRLAYKMWFGSHLPLFYRMAGPGATPECALRTIKELPTGSSLGRNLVLSILGLISRISRNKNFNAK